jgi:hypothetical protein
MGQMVAVTEKPSSTRGVVRFELNRSLSGMGHEHFASVVDAFGDSPSDEVARRLFATGQVGAVHVYANMITVDLLKGATSDGLADIVREMYQYWKPGVEPPTFEDLQPEETPAGGGGEAAGGGGDDAMSRAAQLVPAHLLDRGRAARERWNAKSA